MSSVLIVLPRRVRCGLNPLTNAASAGLVGNAPAATNTLYSALIDESLRLTVAWARPLSDSLLRYAITSANVTPRQSSRLITSVPKNAQRSAWYALRVCGVS